MKAYKCDDCGELFEPYELRISSTTKEEGKKEPITTITTVEAKVLRNRSGQMMYIVGYDTEPKGLDLCKKCLTKVLLSVVG